MKGDVAQKDKTRPEEKLPPFELAQKLSHLQGMFDPVMQEGPRDLHIFMIIFQPDKGCRR